MATEKDKNIPEVTGAPAPVVPEETLAMPAAKSPDATETVTLSKEAFDQLVSDMANMKNEISLRNQVDNQNTAAKIEALRRSGKLIKSVKVRRVDGKYVMRFKTLEDEVYTDQEGKIHEKQLVQITFDDGSTRDLSMRQWASISEYVPFDVISESRDQEGDLFFKVKGADGKELDINVKYVN